MLGVALRLDPLAGRARRQVFLLPHKSALTASARSLDGSRAPRDRRDFQPGEIIPHGMRNSRCAIDWSRVTPRVRVSYISAVLGV